MSEVNLNEEVNVIVEDATVITTPIDDTLSISGDAADAAAVGAALALKADRSELSAQVDVNGQSADAQGHIIITGADIAVSSDDSTKLDAALEALDAKTAADIKMSSSSTSQTIAQAIEDGLSVTADEIPLAEGETTTVAEELERLDDVKGAVKTVNGRTPNSSGNVQVEEVAYARNLVSDAARASVGTFIDRMSGGGASVTDGTAYLQQMRGNMSHTGIVEEVLTMEVSAETSGITAEIDRDTFVEAVTESGTITLEYTTDWSDDPADYGVTVTGSPVDGDTITITYVKADRGTITPAEPSAFTATGWNLYQHSNGYARVLAYDYNYHVGGSYTALAYSATPSGNQTAITVVDGSFTVPADGYVHVTGGDSTTTYITPEWQDWTEGPTASWEAYSENTIDVSSLFGPSALFKYGLLAVGGATYDVIDFEMGIATSRIDRWTYSAANIAAAIASGREYDADEEYIYIVKASADVTSEDISTMDGQFTASDHGIEMIGDTEVPVTCLVLYGNNLKNKLERDVVTLSPQTLTSTQQEQARTNISAASVSYVDSKKPAWYSLLNKTVLTSSYSTKTLILSRKLSDYDLILVECFRGTWIVGTTIATRARFTDATGMEVITKWNGTDIEFDIKFTSDTQVDVKVISTDTNEMSLRLYGINNLD